MTEENTWRDRAPKYGPDDVRLMLAHPTGTTSGKRWITLDAELAVTGDHLFMLELSPEQFADLVASRATVAGSRVPVAVPASGVRQIGDGPLCTRCLIPTTWNLDTHVWDHTEDYATAARSAMRDEHSVTFSPQIGPQWLAVTLTATTNEYLTVPCDGLVHVNEYGTDGSVISASFRRKNRDGKHAAAVRIGNPEWIYRGTGPTSRTILTCPDPNAHALTLTQTPAQAAVNSLDWYTHRVRTYLRNRGVTGSDTLVIRSYHEEGGQIRTTVHGIGMDTSQVRGALDDMFSGARVSTLISGQVLIAWRNVADDTVASDGHAMLTLTVRTKLGGVGAAVHLLNVHTLAHGGSRFTTTVRPKDVTNGWSEDRAVTLLRSLQNMFPEASVAMSDVRDLITMVWPG